MKKLFLILAFAMLSKIGHAQAGYIYYVNTAPSGTCSKGSYQENVFGAGTIYSCQNGTWAQVGSASGSVTSIATTSPITGGTITGTGTIACATCTITIGSGTVTVSGDAPTSGACASEHTASVTNLATTDVVKIGFNSDPSAITGIAPSASGGVYILAYPKSAGTLGLKVCNDTAGTITVGTLVLNYQIVR